MSTVRADLPTCPEDWPGWVVELTLRSGRTVTGEVQSMHATDQEMPTAISLTVDGADDGVHTVVPWHAIETARGKRSW